MTEQYDYVITVKKKDSNGVDAVGFLLYIIGFLTFLRFFLLGYNMMDAVFAILVLVFFVAKLRQRKIRQKYFLRGGLVIIAIGLLAMHFSFWYAGLLYLVAAFLESYAKTPLEIGFNNEFITTNTIPRKHYSWNEVNNAVLKDELLTIDLRGNKLIQYPTEPYSSDVEAEFNAFCTGHTAAAGKKV